MIRIQVIVASNRAAAGVYQDACGPLLVAGFAEQGFEAEPPVVVSDGEPVKRALRTAIGAGVDVIVTSGGTGLTSTDLTPEMTAEVIDRPVPGIAEAVRAHGLGVPPLRESGTGTPYAMLSRGIAGIAGRTLIVNLAGSKGAARDGVAVLAPILPHIVDQIHDGDHPREKS